MFIKITSLQVPFMLQEKCILHTGFCDCMKSTSCSYQLLIDMAYLYLLYLRNELEW